MSVDYTKVNWKNSPSTQTPLNATNLNKMDTAIDDVANWINQNEDKVGDESGLIAAPFSTTKSYSKGDLVVHEKQLYAAKNNVAAGAWNASNFETVTVSAKLTELAESGGKNALRGKRVSILGDSISTFSGYLTPSSNATFYPSGNNSPACDVDSVDDTWWKIVIDKTGMVLGANNAYSGRTLINSATTANVQALGANGDPDIILVYLGTNDANQQVTLGTIDKSVPFNTASESTGAETRGTNLTQAQVDALGNSTFYEAVRTLIIRLQWYYPKAKIVFLTVGFGAYSRFFADNPYRTATIECCDLLGVDYIDTRKIGIHMPKMNAYIFQRVHPNKAGMALIGEYVYNRLMALYGNHIADIDIEDGGDTPADAHLTGLTYTGSLSNDQYSGSPFDPTGLTFTASFSDGSTSDVSSADISFSPTVLSENVSTVIPSYTLDGVTVNATTPISVSVVPTISISSRKFAVRETFADMLPFYTNTIIDASATAPYYKNDSSNRGARRVASGIKPYTTAPNGTVLHVTGGSTIHFVSPASIPFSLQWSCSEVNSAGTVPSGGMHANSWIQGDYTLKPTTEYILLSVSPNDTTAEQHPLTEEQIALIPTAFSITLPEEETTEPSA